MTSLNSVSYLTEITHSTDPMQIFRSELAKHCPWVIVPPDADAGDICRKNPFLFLNISTVASYRDPQRQVQLGKEIREYLGSRLLNKGEKTLDLLQGILVAITWYQFHMSLSVGLTNLLHLAMAQVVELGLSRRPHAIDRQRPAISGLRVLPSDEESARDQPFSLDGPRAYLGCFYFSSVISICIKKMDPMSYTQRTEECCRLLNERSELPSDAYLVHMVQLHHIASRIGQTLLLDEAEVPSGATLRPIQMCVKSFQKDLEELRMSASANLNEPAWLNSLLIHGHIVEMYLHEVGFQLSPKGDDSLLRIQLLHSCLLSAKSFFNELFSIPARSFITAMYIPWAHLIHALAVLSKLSLLEDADWDLVYVRQVLDFAQVIDRILALSNELESHITLPDMFARVVSQMTQLKERYLTRFAILEGRAAPLPRLLRDPMQMNDTAFDAELFEGLDEFLWQDIMSD